jgi:hypothetical protein
MRQDDGVAGDARDLPVPLDEDVIELIGDSSRAARAGQGG